MTKQAFPSLRNKYFWLVAVLGLLAPLLSQADERDLLRSKQAPVNGTWLDSLDYSTLNFGDRFGGRSPRAGRTISDRPHRYATYGNKKSEGHSAMSLPRPFRRMVPCS